MSAQEALDRVKLLCDTSEWLNAEADYWFGVWASGQNATYLGSGPKLGPHAIALVRAAMNGEL